MPRLDGLEPETEKLKQFYAALGLYDWVPPPGLAKADYSDAAIVMAYWLRRVMYCGECRGKGWIYRRQQADLECDCRTGARKDLDRFMNGNL